MVILYGTNKRALFAAALILEKYCTPILIPYLYYFINFYLYTAIVIRIAATRHVECVILMQRCGLEGKNRV